MRGRNIHSFAVVRHGRLVVEKYWSGDAATLRDLYSCTKSVTSALIGIAIAQGHLPDIDRPLTSFFPQADAEPVKRSISIRHLLTMTAGLDWPEWGSWEPGAPPDPVSMMLHSPDWTAFILERPMAHEPGTFFNYCTGASYLLSGILQKATGETPGKFARRELFGPLGISRLEWATDPRGLESGGTGLRLTTRDMLKFGYLYLSSGVWEGREIVPSGWVHDSVQPQSAGYPHMGKYGYHRWVREPSRGSGRREIPSMALAIGYGGQLLYVIPGLDMVVAFTGWHPGNNSLFAEFYLRKFVIPSVMH